jgi:beta-alanine--pyruvate transaminase
MERNSLMILNGWWRCTAPRQLPLSLSNLSLDQPELSGSAADEQVIELFHGYTYSGHPVACAAGLATLDIYQEEGLLTRAAGIAGEWQAAIHGLRVLPNVIDIRTIGLIAGIELEPRHGAVGARAYEAFLKAFEQGVLIRVTGDIIALSPPLIVDGRQIDEIVTTLKRVLQSIT